MAEKMIVMGPDLKLPVDVATEVLAGLGQRKGGKTYGSGVLAEGLLDAGVQVVILDQTDKFYGLRLEPDGKTPSKYQDTLIVLGGKHGDAPLAPEAGALVADLVLESGRSFVLDLSLFSKGQRARFCTEFGERLWMRQKQADNPNVIHIICEEAQLLLPQVIRSAEKGEWSEARMYGVWEEIIRLGRNYGIGASLLTQRPQSVNKEALTQAEIVFAFKTNGRPERKALQDWLTAKSAEDELDLVAELPGLNPKEGEAFIWYPGEGEFRKVHIGPKKTFDSSRTPKVGERRIQAKVKPIDLKALGEAMEAVRAKAEQSDPTALRRRVVQLEKELAKAQSAKPAATTTTKSNDAQVRHLKKALELAMKFILKINAEGFLKNAGPDVDKQELQRALEAALATVTRTVEAKMERRNAEVLRLKTEAERTLKQLKALAEGDINVEVTVQHNEPFTVKPTARPVRPAVAVSPNAPEEVTAPMQRILNTLADFAAMGLTPAPRSPVAVFSDASPRSSAYANNLGRLRTLGLIDYPSGEQIQLTDAGRSVAVANEQPLTDEALHKAWESKLSAPQWAIVKALIEKYPESVHRDDQLAELAGASATSSAYANNLGSLRTLGLIDYKPGKLVVATDLLFLNSRS